MDVPMSVQTQAECGTHAYFVIGEALHLANKRREIARLIICTVGGIETLDGYSAVGKLRPQKSAIIQCFDALNQSFKCKPGSFFFPGDDTIRNCDRF